jgi:hypothetical protein
MTQVRKLVAAAAVAAVLAGVPTMAHAFGAPAKAPAAAAAARAGVVAGSSPTVRVVAPGERVQAVPGVQLWLTKDGKHWSTPEAANQFRSVTDGNLGRPGVSVQTEMAKGHYFLSGVYTGKGNPVTVKVVTTEGLFTGTVVHLAGQPGWGAWYISRELPFMPGSAPSAKHNFVRSVTVTDATGHTIATLTQH